MKKALMAMTFVLATMLVVPVVASAADQLPAGFIAMAPDKMTWDDAKAFCEGKGGKLPSVGGNETMGGAPNKGTVIDGFGGRLGDWPADVPRHSDGQEGYWTSTKDTNPKVAWYVYSKDPRIEVNYHSITKTHFVLCVPCAEK